MELFHVVSMYINVQQLQTVIPGEGVYKEGKGEKTTASRVLVVEPQSNGLLGTPMSSLEDNIKVGIKNVDFERADCIYVANDRDKQWVAFDI